MAFNGRFVLNLAYFAESIGGDKDEFVKVSNFTEEELSSDTCIVSDVVYNEIVEMAVRSTKDEYFGLHAGENLNLAAGGLITQIVQNSRTVKQALEYCCEFANIGCSVLPMSLIEESNHYKIILTPDESWSSKSFVSFQHTVYGVLAFSVQEFFSLTRQKKHPIEVHLPWPKPTNKHEYERVFGCEVLFNKDVISILLEKRDVEEKIVSADFNLLRVLLKYAEEKTSQISKVQGFSSIVKQSLIKLKKPEFPTIEQISSHLNISPRTLQRKLKVEGITFQEIINELRKDFAISYIKRHELSLSEISYLLGYADTSNFNRSFKRWTTMTPKEYRNKLDV